MVAFANYFVKTILFTVCCSVDNTLQCICSIYFELLICLFTESLDFYKLDLNSVNIQVEKINKTEKFPLVRFYVETFVFYQTLMNTTGFLLL